MITIMSPSFFEFLSHLPHHTRNLPENTTLFLQDDGVTTVFRVDQGEVRLIRRQLDGAEFVLQRATSGALVAEASLMSHTYHCSAVTTVPTRLTAWAKPMVQGVITQNTDAATAYAALLAREVRGARLRAEIASLRRISDRLDAWLIWHDGTLPEKGRWHEVAQDINVSPAAFYRELTRRRAAN